MAEETNEETTKHYPHKHSTTFLYRDYMRVLDRKYPKEFAGKLKRTVRELFDYYAHLPDKERFQVMGEGTRLLGLLACEEEMHNRGLRHSFVKTHWEIID